jgi:hypothetical protein
VKAKEKLSDLANTIKKQGEGRTAISRDMVLGLVFPTCWYLTLDKLITLAQMKHPIAKLKVIAK